MDGSFEAGFVEDSWAWRGLDRSASSFAVDYTYREVGGEL